MPYWLVDRSNQASQSPHDAAQAAIHRGFLFSSESVGRAHHGYRDRQSRGEVQHAVGERVGFGHCGGANFSAAFFMTGMLHKSIGEKGVRAGSNRLDIGCYCGAAVLSTEKAAMPKDSQVGLLVFGLLFFSSLAVARTIRCITAVGWLLALCRRESALLVRLVTPPAPSNSQVR
jgi:hypothetical protein